MRYEKNTFSKFTAYSDTSETNINALSIFESVGITDSMHMFILSHNRKPSRMS